MDYTSKMQAARSFQELPQIAKASVQSSLGFLGSCVDGLDSALGALKEKVSPVLTPTPVGESAKDGSPSPAISIIASEIDAQARRIQALTAAIRDLTERVEL